MDEETKHSGYRGNRHQNADKNNSRTWNYARKNSLQFTHRFKIANSRPEFKKFSCRSFNKSKLFLQLPNYVLLFYHFKKSMVYNPHGSPRICAVDCGLKFNQLRCFIKRGARVDVVPWNHKFNIDEYDGLFLSNGPGNPVMCEETIINLKRVLECGKIKPIFGICLGHQLLSVAVGCTSFKMK